MQQCYFVLIFNSERMFYSKLFPVMVWKTSQVTTVTYVPWE